MKYIEIGRIYKPIKYFNMVEVHKPYRIVILGYPTIHSNLLLVDILNTNCYEWFTIKFLINNVLLYAVFEDESEFKLKLQIII